MKDKQKKTKKKQKMKKATAPEWENSHHQPSNVKSSPFTTSSRDSPLLALAPELRNRIYRYTLLSDAPIDATSREALEQPALLTTCRQIREEATGIYYAENTFVGMAHGTYLEPVTEHLLDKIGQKYCRMLAKLQIEPGMFGYGEIRNPDLVCAAGTARFAMAGSVWEMETAREVVVELYHIGVKLDAVEFMVTAAPRSRDEYAEKCWKSGGDAKIEEYRRLKAVAELYCKEM